MIRKCVDLCPSLTPEAVGNLRKAQIYTAVDYVLADTNKLVAASKLPRSDVVTIRHELSKRLGALQQNGRGLFDVLMKTTAILKTGIDRLDKLLRGGLQTGEVIEICGGHAVGKSQLCLSIATHIAYHHQQLVCYIDCKGDFSASRVCELLDHLKVTADEDKIKVLENLKIIKINKLYDLFGVLDDIQKKSEDVQSELRQQNLRLIIIDSLPALFLPLMGGKNYWDGLSSLGQLAAWLKQLSVEYHLVFLVVNNTREEVEGINFGSSSKDTQVQGDSGLVRVYLGKFWAHVPQVRLLLERESEARKCKVTVVKSVRGPVGKSCLIKI